MKKFLLLILASLLGLSGLIGQVPSAHAQSTGVITFNPNSITVADLSPHLVQVTWKTPSSVLVAPNTIHATFSFPKDKVRVSPEQLDIPNATSNPVGGFLSNFTVTLTAAGLASSELKNGTLTVKATAPTTIEGRKYNFSGSLRLAGLLAPPPPAPDPIGSLGDGTNGSTNSGTTASSSSGDAGFGSPLVALLADQKGFVYIAWGIVRTIINLLLIIALLVISFSNILRINIDTYTIKKALPNLVIGVILANASFLIIKYMADIGTVATYLFVNLSYNAGGAHYDTFAKFFSAVLSNLGINSLQTIGSLAGFAFISSPILVLIFVIIALVMVIWLAFLLYFRLVAIYLLTILAPLAFVAYGIPGFEKYFKMWWQQFIKWMFILPAMCAVFWLMLVIGDASSHNQSVASLLIMYLLFMTALTLPSKMGGAIIDKVSKGFQQYTGINAARKYASDEAKNAGNWALSRTPGVYRVQEWNKLRKANFEKDLANRRKAAGNRARGGVVGQREGYLGLEEGRINDQEARVKSANTQRAFDAMDEQQKARLTVAELEKTAAEKRLEEAKKLHKLDFYNKAGQKLEDVEEINKKFIGHIKNVLEEFADATADEQIISGEVSRQEGIINGNKMNELFLVPQALENYKRHITEAQDLTDKYNKLSAEQQQGIEGQRLQANINTANVAASEVERSYNELRKKPEYSQFRNLEISKAVDYLSSDTELGATTDARLVNGRLRQGLKAFNAGVAGQIESEIKEQSVGELERELKEFFSSDLGGDKDPIKARKLMQAFLKGDTAALAAEGIAPHKVRNGIVIAEKYKTILKSTNDVRHVDAGQSWMNTANEYLDDTDKFSREEIDMAGSLDVKTRRQASAVLIQSGPMGRSPGKREQNGGNIRNKVTPINTRARQNTQAPPTTDTEEEEENQ